MAITTAMCTSFKEELMDGVHDLTNDTIKLALIKPSMTGTYGAATTSYADVTGNSDEATGTNYTAGGQTVGTKVTTVTGTTAYFDFADVEWTTSTISADGAILYNDTAVGKPAIAVFDFGGTVSSSAGTFTAQLPAPGGTALIRIE